MKDKAMVKECLKEEYTISVHSNEVKKVNKISRPDLKYTPVIRNLIGFVLMNLCLYQILLYNLKTASVHLYFNEGTEIILNGNQCAFVISLLFGSMWILSRLRFIIIWFILLYQRYAPDHVRAACVYTPSCSEYMILALQKYGLVIGIFKGTHRLFRCHAPNGGTDYP